MDGSDWPVGLRGCGGGRGDTREGVFRAAGMLVRGVCVRGA